MIERNIYAWKWIGCKSKHHVVLIKENEQYKMNGLFTQADYAAWIQCAVMTYLAKEDLKNIWKYLKNHMKMKV
jgi:hypothetical protein